MHAGERVSLHCSPPLNLSPGMIPCCIVPSPSLLADEGDDNWVRHSLIGCLTTLTADRMDFAPIRTLKTIQHYLSEHKTCHASDDPTIPYGRMYRACPNLYY